MRVSARVLPLVTAGLVLSSGLIAQSTPPVKGKGTVVNQKTPQVTKVESQPSVAASTEAAPQPVGFESDIYCFGYVGDPTESFAARVTGAENVAEQTDFVKDDLLYTDAGVDRGLGVGQQFWIVTPEQEIFHPLTGKSLGRLYQYRGRAEVKSVEAHTSSIRITDSCTDVVMGSFLKPFEPIPIPLARRTPSAVAGDPPSGKPSGRIVFTRDGVVALGLGSDVIVDLGVANGVQPGDFLTVYRYSTGTEYGIRPLGTYWVNIPPPPGVSIPRTYLGEAAVLMVGDRWAIARLTESYRLIEVGDEVEIK